MQGSKVGKVDELVPNGEDITISTFFKPVSKNFAPYFRGENNGL